MKVKATLLSLCIVLAAVSSNAFADNVDPANLHFGTGYTGSASGCVEGCAGDPNKVLGSGFDIYNVSNGADIGPLTSTNPLLLILSVPNTDTGATISATQISSVTFYSSPTATSGTAGTYSAAAANTSLDSTGHYSFSNSGFNTGSVYAFLSLDKSSDASNNIPNYTGTGDPGSSGDLGATSFTVYVFDIYGTGSGITLGTNGLVQINFSPNLPLGTIAAGFAESGGKNYDNAYTEAGLVSGHASTPEPGSLLLFGTGLTGLAAFLRKQKLTK
jgi:hypothetical protein